MQAMETVLGDVRDDVETDTEIDTDAIAPGRLDAALEEEQPGVAVGTGTKRPATDCVSDLASGVGDIDGGEADDGGDNDAHCLGESPLDFRQALQSLRI